MFQMQSHTLYQNIIFMTGYNSFNSKHLHCINFTLTKKGDVSQEVISTWPLNQLKNFNADIKIYTSTLLHLQSFLLISDLKLYIKQKFSKSFLTLVLPCKATCSAS